MTQHPNGNPQSAEALQGSTHVSVPAPPIGWSLLLVLGPGLVWCGEYIGSGEVILAPRTGAILGLAVLWVPLIGIFSKFWIGLAGARYTVCTGEGMIDMLSRTPGPKNWVIWITFIGQIAAGAIATGALANVAGIFAAYFIPIKPFYLGWVITLCVVFIAWTGKFNLLKSVMSLLVMLIILGSADVALSTWPGIREVLKGLFGFQVPEIPDWAKASLKDSSSPWREILPLLGWAAGGFASQVWYSYWVLGAGYGMAHGRECGSPMDPAALRGLDAGDAQRLKGWCRVVTCDASMAMVIGIVVTISFTLAGAGVLGPAKLAPEGSQVALELSRMFAEGWGKVGAHIFVLAGLAAFVSTMLGQLAGWPRLLADCARLLIPGVSRFSWKVQFRTILTLFTLSNMVLVYSFGLKPVLLVKTGALLDGLVLTPLQAAAVAWVLYRIMPGFYQAEIAKMLRPPVWIGAGLLLAFVVFSYFCLFQLPGIFGN